MRESDTYISMLGGGRYMDLRVRETDTYISVLGGVYVHMRLLQKCV